MIKSVSEYLLKVPETSDKKELFDEIKEIAKENGNCVLLDFESVLKKDIDKFGYKEGDQFFVLVGEVHGTFAAALKSGLEFTNSVQIAEEFGLPVTDFSSIFDDKTLEFEDKEMDL